MIDSGINTEVCKLSDSLRSQGSSRGAHRSPQMTAVVIPGRAASWWGWVDMEGMSRMRKREGICFMGVKSE